MKRVSMAGMMASLLFAIRGVSGGPMAPLPQWSAPRRGRRYGMKRTGPRFRAFRGIAAPRFKI